MRALMIPLCLLMLFISANLVSCAPPHVSTPRCCPPHRLQSVKIPVWKVVSYWTTPSSCYTKAYVLKTVANKEFCVKPDLTWVQKIVTKLDKMKGASSASPPPHVSTPQCCPRRRLQSVKIPVRKVVSYWTTPSSCYTKAYVFKTKAGKKICVDPDLPWVKGSVKKLKERDAGFNQQTPAALMI